jgi:hypothetical protein
VPGHSCQLQTTTDLVSSLSAVTPPQPITLTVDASAPGKAISPDLVGIFFEDLCHSADGWLYPELVQNRDFEYSSANRAEWHTLTFWQVVHRDGGKGRLTSEFTKPLHANSPHYAVLTIESASSDGLDNIYHRKDTTCHGAHSPDRACRALEPHHPRSQPLSSLECSPPIRRRPSSATPSICRPGLDAQRSPPRLRHESLGLFFVKGHEELEARRLAAQADRLRLGHGRSLVHPSRMNRWSKSGVWDRVFERCIRRDWCIWS